MTKVRFAGVMLVALVAVLGTSVLVASNMGFKLNLSLLGPGSSVPAQETAGDGNSDDGTNTLSLPYIPQVGLANASDLFVDASVQSVQLFSRDTNAGLSAYTGGGKGSGPDFALTPGVSVQVKVGADASYIVVGAHDPGFQVDLLGPGSAVPAQESAADGNSDDGTNFYSYAYHSTCPDAACLFTEIGAQSLQLFSRDTNAGLSAYTGGGKGSGPNFTLNPGEGYFVKVGADTPHTPSHY